ncbi:MAG TPA: hypothetical protein P5232_00855 [Candidatus Moranbacteria bacterium]|nr:hypothetical protein [Candidatus Moranbacteria bacterium]
MRKKLIIQSLLLSLGEIIYLLFLSLLMSNDKFFANEHNSMISFIVVLLLFVFSAAVSGAFVLGKPAMLFLEGKKKEAMELFSYILGWMLIFLVVLFLTFAF